MIRIDATAMPPRLGAVPAVTALRSPGGPGAELLKPHMAALPAAQPAPAASALAAGLRQAPAAAIASQALPMADADGASGLLRAMQPPVLLPAGLRSAAQAAQNAPLVATALAPSAAAVSNASAHAPPLASVWRAQVLSAEASAEASAGMPLERPIYPLFLLQPWAGVSASLWLLDPERENDEAAASNLDAAPCALRVQLQLQTLGRVTLHLQQAGAPGAGSGVLLALAVERPDAVPWMRQALPAMSAACARGGLRLLRCRMEAGQGASPPFTRPQLPRRAAPARLSPPLFQVLAELIAVLEAADRAAAAAAVSV